MCARKMIFAVSVYQYLSVMITSILFLIVPWMESRQYFDSLFVDILARCILWLYFVGSYWSMASGIKNALNKRNNLFFISHKSIATFILLGISASITGTFLIVLTKWSLSIYAPEIPSELAFIMSLGNGVIYAILGMSQYCFLPEE